MVWASMIRSAGLWDLGPAGDRAISILEAALSLTRPSGRSFDGVEQAVVNVVYGPISIF